jgi:hypothetical protein
VKNTEQKPIVFSQRGWEVEKWASMYAVTFLERPVVAIAEDFVDLAELSFTVEDVDSIIPSNALGINMAGQRIMTLPGIN